MKKIVFLCLSFLAAISYAAQLDWGAFNISSNLTGGTAYLIQTTSSVNLNSIYTTLSQGIPSEVPSGYTKWDSATVSDDGGTGTVSKLLTVTETPAYGDQGSYFVVIISDDSTQFSLSALEQGSSGDGGTLVEVSFNLDYSDSYWTDGVIGTTPVDPSVPEPTVLALLALGVAGLALKRKTV